MPFKNRSQQRACYAKKSRNQAGSWDCDEWSDHTNFTKLPEKAAAFATLLGKLAADISPTQPVPAMPASAPQTTIPSAPEPPPQNLATRLLSHGIMSGAQPAQNAGMGANIMNRGAQALTNPIGSMANWMTQRR